MMIERKMIMNAETGDLMLAVYSLVDSKIKKEVYIGSAARKDGKWSGMVEKVEERTAR